MADPVRLYNPNPDAPNVWGAPPTKRNPLAEALASVPSPFDVFSPPPEARKAYGSLAQAVVDATSPAAVRDTVDASGQTMNALREGRGWDAAGGAASMLAAAAGVVPGGRLITKGAKELAQPIRAYHATTKEYEQFQPGWRGATYFASTPERARHGATAGANEFTKGSPGVAGDGKPLKTLEVAIPNEGISGLHLTPSEAKWFDALPPRIVGDAAFESAVTKTMPKNFQYWDDLYDAKEIAPGSFEYVKKPQPALSYEEAYTSGRDVYGRQHPHYGNQMDEAGTAARHQAEGMRGYLLSDEAGLSIAMADPSLIEILRKYGLLPVAAGTAVAGATLPQEGGDY